MYANEIKHTQMIPYLLICTNVEISCVVLLIVQIYLDQIQNSSYRNTKQALV